MQAEQIPAAKIDLEGSKPDQRYESYRVAAGPLCDARPIQGDDAEDARCEGWCVDDLLVCRTAYSPTLFRRTPAQAREGGGFLLQINYAGEQVGEVDGHPLRLTEGRIVLQDIARPYSSMGHVRDSVGVLVPRHRIRGHERLYRRRPVVEFEASSAEGQILSHTLRSLLDQLPGLTRTSATGISAGFVGLLNGLLGNRLGDPRSGASGSPEEAAVEEANLDAMKAYLVRQLHEPGLSPEALCKTFHCSRAKVYRLFAKEGGVAAFIREKRLLKCFEDLHGADPRRKGRGTTVGAIAERWGFGDPYHFSKLFKKTFGMPPSEILAAAPPVASAPVSGVEADSGGHALRNWVLGTIEAHSQPN